MAAFSYQQHQTSLHLEPSVYLQSSQMSRISGLLEDQNNNITTLFPHQFYQPQSHHEIPAKSNTINESSCFLAQQGIKVTNFSNNGTTSLTNKTCTDSSSVTDKIESGEQVTQKVPVMEKKRKTKEGPTVNSAQSKAIEKKQRKGGRVLTEDEEKKSKEYKKDEKKKAADQDAPTGYIHVRARRGQATDSHSLAERVRREKISERMKLLQALVPGCDKVTGKALMLDEIINYVQSLQNQVEFLSMKLASLNPMFYDFGMDLDAFMIRPDQTLSNMASPVQNMQPPCDPMQPLIISESNSTMRNASANNFSEMETSTSVLFQQGHNIPQILSQANGQLLWDVDDQRQIY